MGGNESKDREGNSQPQTKNQLESVDVSESKKIIENNNGGRDVEGDERDQEFEKQEQSDNLQKCRLFSLTAQLQGCEEAKRVCTPRSITYTKVY